MVAALSYFPATLDWIVLHIASALSCFSATFPLLWADTWWHTLNHGIRWSCSDLHPSYFPVTSLLLWSDIWYTLLIHWANSQLLWAKALDTSCLLWTTLCSYSGLKHGTHGSFFEAISSCSELKKDTPPGYSQLFPSYYELIYDTHYSCSELLLCYFELQTLGSWSNMPATCQLLWAEIWHISPLLQTTFKLLWAKPWLASWLFWATSQLFWAESWHTLQLRWFNTQLLSSYVPTTLIWNITHVTATQLQWPETLHMSLLLHYISHLLPSYFELKKDTHPGCSKLFTSYYEQIYNPYCSWSELSLCYFEL